MNPVFRSHADPRGPETAASRPSRLRLLPLLLAMFAGGACSGIEVSADHQGGAAYASYRTYIWLPDSAPSDRAQAMGVSDFVRDRIKEAVQADLKDKDLVELPPKDAEKADLYVTTSISIERDLVLNDPYFAYDRVRTVEKGTLLIDFIDSKTKKIVWSGRGKTRIGSYPTLEQREARVRQVVHAILAQYPPNS